MATDKVHIYCQIRAYSIRLIPVGLAMCMLLCLVGCEKKSSGRVSRDFEGVKAATTIESFDSGGVRLKCAGEIIDVNIGHLVPSVADWNGDGKKDIIVGQFSGGQIRLYLNQGTDAAPEFKDFSYLQAGNKEIRLPAG